MIATVVAFFKSYISKDDLMYVFFFLEEALFVFLYFHLRNIHKPCH